jgi:hypothetical protein
MALEHVPRCQHVKVNGVQCGSPALRRRAHCYFHTRVEHERQAATEVRDGKRSFGFPLLEDANSIQVALMKVVQMLGAGTLDHKTASLMLYALQTASYNLRNTRFEPEKLTDVVIDEDTVDLTHMEGPQWAARDFPPSAPADVQRIMDEDSGQEDSAEDDRVQDDSCVSELARGGSEKEALEKEELKIEDSKKEEPEHAPAAASRAPVTVNVKPEAKANIPCVTKTQRQRPEAATVNPEISDIARRRAEKRKLHRDLEAGEQDSLAYVLLKRMGLPTTPIEDDEEVGTLPSGNRSDKGQ